MLEQNSAPKKEKVGSLFFHLFNRLSLWLYTLLISSFVARLLTSYDVMEQRWSDICLRIFGARDGKLRQSLRKARLGCAHLIEHSKILYVLDKTVKHFIHLPLNVYGIFFFVYGAIGAAMYFLAERLSVNYAGTLGWGITGIIIAFASLPLLGTGKSVYRTAFGSRIIGKILRSYLGLEQKQSANEGKERGGTLLVYAALLFGVGAGVLTFFFHPATVPVVALMLVLTVMILYIPESGVLLAAGTLGLWWATGYPSLCAIAIATVTFISYFNKLIRGKRVLHVRLLDFAVILLMCVFSLHGWIVGSGWLSTLYGIGYAALIAMYLPAVNLMRSREWLNRCYSLLAFSGVVLAVTAILPVEPLLYFLNMTIKQVDLSMFAQVSERYASFVEQASMAGGMLLLLLPLMLIRLVDKHTITGFFWKLLWVVAACVALILFMDIGVWSGLLVALLLLFLTYSYRSLSAAMLLVFPVSCGVVWTEEINHFLGIEKLEAYRSMLDVAVTYADSRAHRSAIAQSVIGMSRDHLLGVGFGDNTVSSVLAYYAQPGIEEALIHNTFLQLIAEIGYPGLIVLLGTLLLFTLCVLTYLHWGGNQTTKARAVAGLAGVAGVLIMGLNCNIMNNASLFGLLWLMIGLSVASLRTQYDIHARAINTHASTNERTDIAFRTK